MFNLFKGTEIIKDEKAIEEFLTRGVERIYPSKDFLKAQLNGDRQLTMYLGIDPTGTTLHMGHAIPLIKLSQFQKLGHKVILLIGDSTAMIGDPTDKTSTRIPLTHKKVLENARLYKKQASNFISFSGSNPAILKYNSKWLSKMSMEETLELMSNMTYAQTIKRDMFQERIAQGKDLSLHEFMYPIMQGYDSVAMDVDGEVGGNDQTFNMLVGRDLLKKMKNKEKFVIGMKLLIDSSGKKMGKTEGNMVSFDETADVIFGKVMSWSDNLIIPGFELLTTVPESDIFSIKSSIESGANPKDSKAILAKHIVSMVHGTKKADKAEQNFVNAFSKGEIPTDIQTMEVPKGSLVRDVLVKEEIIDSNSDWKRLIDGKAVSHAGTDEIVIDTFVKIEKDMTLRIGKKRFVKLITR